MKSESERLMKTKDFSEEVTYEAKPLKGFAMKLTQNPDDAEDLLQDTLLKALANKDKFQEGTNLKGWLYTIMKNIFINKYRRAVKSKIFFDDTEGQYYINSATSGTSRNEGESSLILKDIRTAIEGLSSKLRDPFMMSYTGYKYEEIASFLHLPLGTVKVRIHNARQELMKSLTSYGKERPAKHSQKH
jgi:RNA polymerase sigma-70 factor (ECF subfamily)